MSKEIPVIYELDDNGEATGIVHPYCSDLCCDRDEAGEFHDKKKYSRGTFPISPLCDMVYCDLCSNLISVQKTSAEDKAIKLWAWDDAPEELKKLSPHGGDEDFVWLIPAALAQELERFSLIEISLPGLDRYADPFKVSLADGSIVIIVAH